MPKIGEITVTENPGEGTNHKDTPEKFLYENQAMITDATSLLSDARITSIPTDITTALKNSPGLDSSAFSVGGKAPLNAVAVQFASNTETDYEQFSILKNLIESDANNHMYEEGGTNYVIIFTKYQELCTAAIEAAKTYNSNRNKGTTTRTEGSGDDQKTITIYHFYPECGISCPIDAAPTLTWSETFPPGTGSLPANSEYTFEEASGSSYYTDFREKFDKVKKFWAHYGEDTNSFKNATAGLKASEDSADFETKLSDLNNNWPAGLSPSGEETPITGPEGSEEKDNPPVTPDEKPEDTGQQSTGLQVCRYDKVDVDDPVLAKSLGVDQEGHELHYYGSLTDTEGNSIPLYYDNGEHNQTFVGSLFDTHDAARLFTIVNGEKCYISNSPNTQAYNETAGSGAGAGTAFHYDVSILTDSNGEPSESYLDFITTKSAKGTIFYNQTGGNGKDGELYYKDQTGQTHTLDTNTWSHTSDLQNIGNYPAGGGDE